MTCHNKWIWLFQYSFRTHRFLLWGRGSLRGPQLTLVTLLTTFPFFVFYPPKPMPHKSHDSVYPHSYYFMFWFPSNKYSWMSSLSHSMLEIFGSLPSYCGLFFQVSKYSIFSIRKFIVKLWFSIPEKLQVIKSQR